VEFVQSCDGHQHGWNATKKFYMIIVVSAHSIVSNLFSPR